MVALFAPQAAMGRYLAALVISLGGLHLLLASMQAPVMQPVRLAVHDTRITLQHITFRQAAAVPQLTPAPSKPKAAKPVKLAVAKPASAKAVPVANPAPAPQPETAFAPTPAPASVPAAPAAAASITPIPVQTAARFANPPPPIAYPRQAIRRGVEGTALLQVLVMPDGRTSTVRLVESSGSPLLDQAALDGVRSWPFLPAEAEGKTILSWVQIPVQFILRERK